MPLGIFPTELLLKFVNEGLVGHQKAVLSLACSPDGKHIVSGSEDRTLLIWDAETHSVVRGPLEGHTASVNTVVYSVDGMRIISGSWDETIRIWDATTGEPFGEPLQGRSSGVRSIVCSPDGTRFASASNDGTIRVWDVNGTAVASARCVAYNCLSDIF